MGNRSFANKLPKTGDCCSIAGPEAHHLIHVLRLGPGDELVLFDGSGREAVAHVSKRTKRDVEVKVAEIRTVDREVDANLVICSALPKGDRARFMFEKLTELGVTQFIPVLSERTPPETRRLNLDKAQRWVIEACKQSGRNRFMSIAQPQPILSILESTDKSMTRLLASPQSPTRMLTGESQGGSTVALVGPEGGLSEQEVDVADDCGWDQVSLGNRVLRVETAAIVMAAICSLRSRA